MISHIGFHHIETFKLVSFLFLCSCNDASVFWIYRFVSIWNVISLWYFELKSELKSSGKHNGSKSMLPIRGLGRQLSYHPYHHFMRIENGFLGKKSSFMKLGASIGNGNRTLFLEKTQTDSEANYQKKNITITHEIHQIRSFVLHSYRLKHYLNSKTLLLLGNWGGSTVRCSLLF